MSVSPTFFLYNLVKCIGGISSYENRYKRGGTCEEKKQRED